MNTFSRKNIVRGNVTAALRDPRETYWVARKTTTKTAKETPTSTGATPEASRQRWRCPCSPEPSEDSPDVAQDGGAACDDLNDREVVKRRTVRERERAVHDLGDHDGGQQALRHVHLRITNTPARQPRTRKTFGPRQRCRFRAGGYRSPSPASKR